MGTAVAPRFDRIPSLTLQEKIMKRKLNLLLLPTSLLIASLYCFSGCQTDSTAISDSDDGQHIALKLTSENFEKEILRSSQVALVDVWVPG
jgi:hypothetical protein